MGDVEGARKEGRIHKLVLCVIECEEKGGGREAYRVA